ncbi:MAG: molybdopterin-dependent oxidoreductase [Actinobacteria bacterium]|nr:molybdopterin-dependent oxidoreductase [Actinomycetota bacterium]
MKGRGYLTPAELFFVRNHTSTPAIDVDDWRLRIHGDGVDHDVFLSYDDLRRLPQETIVRALECAGNGRSVFADQHGEELDETPWKLGAIGVAEWGGVRLSRVLDVAGLKPSARDVMPVGLDDLEVRRPLPRAKATAPDTLLALDMNGEPLLADHGFPCRVVASGWAAVASIKWVGSIEVSCRTLLSPWNTDTYVLKGPGFEDDNPHGGSVITMQKVKSALELPWPARLPQGEHVVSGRAWSGEGSIAWVEWSDGGPWQRATLIEPNLPAAWVRFQFVWRARAGEHEVRTRAGDDSGAVQGDHIGWNELGYLYDAVAPHPISVEAVCGGGVCVSQSRE